MGVKSTKLHVKLVHYQVILKINLKSIFKLYLCAFLWWTIMWLFISKILLIRVKFIFKLYWHVFLRRTIIGVSIWELKKMGVKSTKLHVKLVHYQVLLKINLKSIFKLYLHFFLWWTITWLFISKIFLICVKYIF